MNKLLIFSEATDLLKNVVLGKWDVRFDQIEVTTLTDMSRLFNYLNYYGYLDKVLSLVDQRVVPKASMTLDLRVEVQWDTDLTNVELLVKEPTGEKCYSLNNKTKIGGFMSRDFTGGYGPQEYLLKKAIYGRYGVFVRLYGQRRENYMGTTVQVRIYTYFGSPSKENVYVYVARLNNVKEEIEICNVEFSSTNIQPKIISNPFL